MGQVQHITLLYRHVEKLTPGFKNQAFPFRRSAEVLNIFFHIFTPGHFQGEIADHIYRYGLVSLCSCIHKVKLPPCFENQFIIAGRKIRDIKILQKSKLLRIFSFGIIDPDIQTHVLPLVREKKDLISHPGRFPVDGVTVCNILCTLVKQIVYKDI